MENKDKVFMSQQLCCMLQPLACKVMFYILGWQNANVIKYYEKQFCKFLHLSPREVEVGIQTLVDNHLIDVSNIDNGWVIEINKDTVRKYFNVSMQTVHDHDVLPLSTKVTWNVVEEEQPKQGSKLDMASMSDEQLKNLLLRIEASLNERQQVKELIKSNEPTDDNYGLPF